MTAPRDGLSEERLAPEPPDVDAERLEYLVGAPEEADGGDIEAMARELLDLRAKNVNIEHSRQRYAAQLAAAQSFGNMQKKRAEKAEAERDAAREALRDYGEHGRDCLRGQAHGGRPTPDGGYETCYGYGSHERWYPRGEKPPCSCGLSAALGEQP